ncbi:MAG: UxaA family hydrolase, partial [bacterium]
MTAVVELHEVGRLPTPEDNVAIAGLRLEAGTLIGNGGDTFALSHTVLEGHRFAVRPVAKGEAVLSWGLPFGTALRPIAPGGYLCNARVLTALGLRKLDFSLPGEPNFEDRLVRHEFDPATFRPGRQVERYPEPITFAGYGREAGRGAGTRNHVVVLGTSSLTAGYARMLAGRLKGATADLAHVDQVVAVTHSEGGAEEAPNNREFLLRTLAGFISHPNVGAVLAVDRGTEVVNNRVLAEFLAERGYPRDGKTRRFLTLEGELQPMLERGEQIVRGWLPLLNECRRTPQPMEHLKLALQCGGSDAFSGVSGNPLAGWIAREVIRHGGSANLAETDELIGAERYVLDNVRDAETARAFLQKIDIFRERAGWHGQSVEGNPSAGNIFRGLYNITLKSIGAARKRDPQVRVDGVLDYGEPMGEPGYYFMDSPGNDLESIAGQVASGANMILFITGNGSITNFPFVPTIKIMTTSARYRLLADDMDINAGRYQDGTPMDELGAEAFAYTCQVAAGQPSVGERAGRHQVSIWRDWRQTGPGNLETLLAAPAPDGRALSLRPQPQTIDPPVYRALQTERGPAAEQVGLVVPASLCSGQIAAMIADRLNDGGAPAGVSRFVALVHTEGCGSGGGGGEAVRLFLRTIAGHLCHPLVKKALVLEHGCEGTVNDYIKNFLDGEGIDPTRFGWASVQMDGGIEKAVGGAVEWFQRELAEAGENQIVEASAADLRVALLAIGRPGQPQARALAMVARTIAGAGGRVIVPANAPLLEPGPFVEELLATGRPAPTLA